MKIYSTNRINALGLVGPEKFPEAIDKISDLEIEKIIVDNGNIEESEKILFNRANEIFKNKDKSLFLGGDHSITYPIFQAFKKNYKNPFLIIFDAHPDCMSPQKEPTHEEFLRAIIENGFPSENIILIGIRKIEPEEKLFLIENKIKVFDSNLDLELATDYITEKANYNDVYISVDVDAIDPAFAPAVNYPEPAGLSSKEFFYIFKRLLKIKTLKAVDIVEVVPEKDKNFDNQTMKIVSKIIEEFLEINY